MTSATFTPMFLNNVTIGCTVTFAIVSLIIFFKMGDPKVAKKRVSLAFFISMILPLGCLLVTMTDFSVIPLLYLVALLVALTAAVVALCSGTSIHLDREDVNANRVLSVISIICMSWATALVVF